MKKHRVVVLGGGLSGLSVAHQMKLQLGDSCEVILLEKQLLGQGSSILNGQTLHSGAAYLYTQPEAAKMCQQVSQEFASFFAPYIVSQSSWYLAPRALELDFLEKCAEIGIPKQEISVVPQNVLDTVLQKEKTRDNLAISLPELQIDTRMVIVELAQKCLDLGVDIRLGASVVKVIANAQSTVTGIQTSLDEHIFCDHLVVAAGSGISHLLQELYPPVAESITSVRTMHLLAPSHGLQHPVRGNKIGFPVVIPQRCTSKTSFQDSFVALGSFGAWQRRLGETQESISDDTKQVKEKLKIVSEWFQPHLIDIDRVQTFQVDKTEYLRNPLSGRDARPYVGRVGDIQGLTLLVPGKLEFALCSARSIVQSVCDSFGMGRVDFRQPENSVSVIKEKTLSMVFDPFDNLLKNHDKKNKSHLPAKPDTNQNNQHSKRKRVA